MSGPGAAPDDSQPAKLSEKETTLLRASLVCVALPGLWVLARGLPGLFEAMPYSLAVLPLLVWALGPLLFVGGLSLLMLTGHWLPHDPTKRTVRVWSLAGASLAMLVAYALPLFEDATSLWRDEKAGLLLLFIPLWGGLVGLAVAAVAGGLGVYFGRARERHDTSA